MPYPHAFITLTPAERERIKQELQRLAGLHQWKKRKPLQSLYLSDRKMPYRNIANYLKVSYMSVRRWIYQYRKDGLNTFLKHAPHE